MKGSHGKVRYGVIGLGIAGCGHIENLSRARHGRLAAVTDTDPLRAARISKKFDVPGFKSSGELIRSGIADAVIVATPHPFHEAVSIDAFEHGLHVLCEKPMAVSVAEADRMIKAASLAGCVLGIALQNRMRREILKARQWIQEGSIGEVIRGNLIASHWFRTQAYYDSAPWRGTWMGEGGGILLNQALHQIDLLIWLAGKPVSVQARTQTRLHKIEVEDEAVAMLKFSTGALGVVNVSANDCPGIERLEIYGDQGLILIEGGKLTLLKTSESAQLHLKKSTEIWSRPNVRSKVCVFKSKVKNHLALLDQHSQCILNGEPFIATGEEGIKGLEVVNAILQSGHTGREIHLPLNRRRYEAFLASRKGSAKD